MTFLDKTFCGSPHCQNECGRQMTQEEKEYLKKLAWTRPDESAFICHAYFCGEPKENKE